MEIRSYRKVFDLERRVYSVDRLRLNPGGVPVRGIVYFLAIVSAGLVLARLPLSSRLTTVLPWYLRDFALPGFAATVLSVIRVEGRTFHLAARALVRYRFGPRLLTGFQRCESFTGKHWSLAEIVFLPDGSDARMRRLRYAGPGAVLVSIEHERAGRAVEAGASGLAHKGFGPALTLREPPGRKPRELERGQVIALGSGARLLVRSSDRAGVANG